MSSTAYFQNETSPTAPTALARAVFACYIDYYQGNPQSVFIISIAVHSSKVGLNTLQDAFSNRVSKYLKYSTIMYDRALTSPRIQPPDH